MSRDTANIEASVKPPGVRRVPSKPSSETVLSMKRADAMAIPKPASFLGSTALDFVTEDKSPWSDGYSLEGERAALADVLDADDAEMDPRWPRVIEFEKREAELRSAQSRYRQRNGAEDIVQDAQATSFNRLGGLVDEQRDTITVHTREGSRLFVGRKPSFDGQVEGIPGGMNQGAALLHLWRMTENNNPYAEWALLLHEQEHARLRKLIADEVAESVEQMARLAKRGLQINLLSSSSPVGLALGFGSPYGYAICELVADYDLFIRYVKTLERKNQLSDQKARAKINNITRQIRASWLDMVIFEKRLKDETIKDLCRADFLPTAGQAAQQRVQAAMSLFGAPPLPVLEGYKQPRHSKNRVTITDAERGLLRQAHQNLERDTDEEVQPDIAEAMPTKVLQPQASASVAQTASLS